MNIEFIDKPYIITYSNWLEFDGKTLAFRKKLLFDITGIPKALFTSSNNGYFGYWINRKWLSESKIKELIKYEPKQVDVSNLQWYEQEQLNHVFNLK
jgi:hypothetical protein